LPLSGGYNRLTYALSEVFVTVLLRGRINRWCTQTLGLPLYKGPGLFTALRQSDTPTGVVKLTAERKNLFHFAGISSASEALTSHLG
jgi:hypothetical protein